MITKFKYFIKESCDVVTLENGKEVHFYREDNYAFLYFDGNMKYKPLEDSNLYMNLPGISFRGLFGGLNGIVSNVGLVNISISGIDNFSGMGVGSVYYNSRIFICN